MYRAKSSAVSWSLLAQHAWVAGACSRLIVARSEGEGGSIALFGVMAGNVCFFTGCRGVQLKSSI